MTLENISLSISMKSWGWAGIKLMTSGSAIRPATDCATGPAYNRVPTKIQKQNSMIFPCSTM